MKKTFAVPTENGTLCTHFGHCENFVLIESEDQKIISEKTISPPAHQPGAYPKFLSELGVNVIIAGGMGHKARELFSTKHIDVCMGVDPGNPTDLVKQYLSGRLQAGTNLCDH